MFTFHERSHPSEAEKDATIAVFNGEGEPIGAKHRNVLVLRLNMLGGLDPDDKLWNDIGTAGDLRVAEVLEDQSVPNEAVESLRKLGAAVIRRLVSENDKFQKLYKSRDADAVTLANECERILRSLSDLRQPASVRGTDSNGAT